MPEDNDRFSSEDRSKISNRDKNPIEQQKETLKPGEKGGQTKKPGVNRQDSRGISFTDQRRDLPAQT